MSIVSWLVAIFPQWPRLTKRPLPEICWAQWLRTNGRTQTSGLMCGSGVTPNLLVTTGFLALHITRGPRNLLLVWADYGGTVMLSLTVIYCDPDFGTGMPDLAVSGPKRDHIPIVLPVWLPSPELTDFVRSLEARILRTASFAHLPGIPLRVLGLFLSASIV